MSPARRIFGQFLGLVLIVAAALLTVGWVPTRNVAGDEALKAMVAGCAIAAVASLVGTLPVILARNKPHLDAWTAALVAMGVRLAVIVALGAAVALSGTVPARPLLLWLVLSHAGFLVPDTLLSIQVLARQALAENR